jgi:hypothetical protein
MNKLRTSQKIFAKSFLGTFIVACLAVSGGCGKAAKLVGKAADELYEGSDEAAKVLDDKIDDILNKNHPLPDTGVATHNKSNFLQDYLVYTTPPRVARAINREREKADNEKESALWLLSHEVTYVILGLETEAYAVLQTSGCSREIKMHMDMIVPHEELPDGHVFGARFLISETENVQSTQMETFSGGQSAIVEYSTGEVIQTLQEFDADEHWKASKIDGKWLVTNFIDNTEQQIDHPNIVSSWGSEANIIKNLGDHEAEYTEHIIDSDSDSLFSIDTVRIRPLEISDLTYPAWQVDVTSRYTSDGKEQEETYRAIYTKNGISPVMWLEIDGKVAQFVATDIEVSDEGFCDISSAANL